MKYLAFLLALVTFQTTAFAESGPSWKTCIYRLARNYLDTHDQASVKLSGDVEWFWDFVPYYNLTGETSDGSPLLIQISAHATRQNREWSCQFRYTRDGQPFVWIVRR